MKRSNTSTNHKENNSSIAKKRITIKHNATDHSTKKHKVETSANNEFYVANYLNKEHNIENIANDEFLCDLKISFKNSNNVHNVISIEMAERSLYFERLLHYEKNQGMLVLPEFLKNTFTQILKFMRTGNVEITEETVFDLFFSADYLLLTKLKEDCLNFLNKMANHTQLAVAIWLSTLHLFCPEINELALQKILEQFPRLWFAQEFLELNIDNVIVILSHDELNCATEWLVYEAIIRWISYKHDKRQKNIDILLPCVRHGLLTNSELNHVRETELIAGQASSVNLVDEWINLHNNLNYSQINESFRTPRIPYTSIFVFGGWCEEEGGPRSAVQVYNPRANNWSLWAAESSSQNQNGCSTSQAFQGEVVNPGGDCQHHLGDIPRRVYAGCAIVNNMAFVVGGYDGTQVLKSTIGYDLLSENGMWQTLGCMYEKRHYVCVVASQGYVYALGGHSGKAQGRLRSAERYHIATNLWQCIEPMSSIRSDASAAELDGRVYVCGGFEGKHYHDSVEVYNAEANQWTILEGRMCSPRGGLSIAQHGWSLFAIGGNDGNRRLDTVERFDLATGRWSIIGRMSRGKSNLSSAVIDSDIYILGGWSDENNSGILNTVERIDARTGQIDRISNLAFGASATCSASFSNKNVLKRYLNKYMPVAPPMNSNEYKNISSSSASCSGNDGPASQSSMSRLSSDESSSSISTQVSFRIDSSDITVLDDL